MENIIITKQKWEKELGERTSSLYAQEPYKNLTASNSLQYDDTKKQINFLNLMIEQCDRMIENYEEYRELQNTDEYDDHLDTGMDTSKSSTEY